MIERQQVFEFFKGLRVGDIFEAKTFHNGKPLNFVAKVIDITKQDGSVPIIDLEFPSGILEKHALNETILAHLVFNELYLCTDNVWSCIIKLNTLKARFEEFNRKLALEIKQYEAKSKEKD